MESRTDILWNIYFKNSIERIVSNKNEIIFSNILNFLLHN